MSIQLQPHKLEQQQFNDLLQLTSASDKEALKYFSQHQNLTFASSKVLVYSQNQLLQQQNQSQGQQDKT
jgi:hypothetical protein